MSVILFILKLIGILLLVFFGILLGCIMLLLFAPVRYHVQGVLETAPVIQMKLTWLLQLVSFTLEYQDKELTTVFRILGIRRKGSRAAGEAQEAGDVSREESEASIKAASCEEQQTAAKTASEKKQATAAEAVSEKEQAAAAEAVSKKEEACTAAEAASEKEQVAAAEAASETGAKEPSHRQRRRLGIREFGEKIQRVCCTLPQFFQKCFHETNRSVARAFFAEFKYLLRHFKFRKLFTDLRFSLGEPDRTGQALGILSMLPILYRYQVHIVPDFEAEELYVKGTFEIKGHIRAVHALMTLLHLYQKKETRIFIKNLLDGKDGQENGRQ